MKLILILVLFIQATIITCDAPQAGGLYLIFPKGSGKALGIQGSSNDVGARLVAEAIACDDSQKFTLNQYDANSFTVIVKSSGLVWTANGASAADFSYLYQREENHAVYYQEIAFIPGPDGYYYIRMSPYNTEDYTLNIDGQSLTFEPITGADNQLFWLQATTTTTNQCKDCVAPQAYLAATHDCGTCSAPQIYNPNAYACENCPNGDSYNYDGTCIPNGECPNNLRDEQGGFPICKFPCRQTQIYQPITNRCQCSCSSPFTTEIVNGYQVCVMA